MGWEAIGGLVKPELLIVVAACWVVGYILKQTPKVPNWSIVYFVTVLAVVAAGLLLGWAVESVLQGILCGAVSVYGNQLYRQTLRAVKEADIGPQ